MIAILLIAAGCNAALTPAPAVTEPVQLTAPSPTPTLTPTLRPTATPAPTPTSAPTAAPSPTPKPTVKPVDPSSGIIYYNGFADPRTIEPAAVADPLNLTALVNKFFALPADFVPPLMTADGTNAQIQPAVNDAWIALRDNCLAATGVNLELISAYRSYAEQASQFLDAIRRKGIASTVNYNALEGRSEHQLGLALDFGDGVTKDFSLAFAKSAAGVWLAQNAYNYGFILRYPSGRESVTDYAYEAWHYRYVGIETAALCFANNWTLEEYIQSIG